DLRHPAPRTLGFSGEDVADDAIVVDEHAIGDEVEIAPDGRIIPADNAVVERQRPRVDEDASPLSGGVAGQDAFADCHGPDVPDDATVASGGGVADQDAAGDRQRPGVRDAAADDGRVAG